MIDEHLAREICALRRLSNAIFIKSLHLHGALAAKTAQDILSDMITSSVDSRHISEWIQSCMEIYGALKHSQPHFDSDGTVQQKIEDRLKELIKSSTEVRRFLQVVHQYSSADEEMTAKMRKDLIHKEESGPEINNLMETVYPKILGGISLVKLLKYYCFIDYSVKDDLRDDLRQNEQLWAQRPLPEKMVEAASNDVLHLHSLFEVLKVEMHTNRSQPTETQRIIYTILQRSLLYIHGFRLGIEYEESLERTKEQRRTKLQSEMEEIKLKIDEHKDDVWTRKNHERRLEKLQRLEDEEIQNSQSNVYSYKDVPFAELSNDSVDKHSDQIMRIVHTNRIGWVVGRRSMFLQFLRVNLPQCEVFTSGYQRPPIGTLTLIGTQAEVDTMFSLFPEEHSINVNASDVGRIIGKQGTVIRTIQTLSRVRSMRFVDLDQSSNAKILKIEGDRESIERAVKLITAHHQPQLR